MPRKKKVTPKEASAIQTEIDATLAQVRAIRARADEVPLTEQARLLASCASTLTQLGKLSGEAQEISETRLLRSPAWRRVQDALVKSLEPWPKAMLAASTALRELGGA